MPKANSRKKIASAPKHWILVVGLAGLGLILLSFVYARKATAPANTIAINHRLFKVVYADTSAEQEKGLGDRDNLPADQAMLFRFPAAAKQCFWMKDMRFNLDIIWLDSHKKVVHVEPNLSPQTYPQTYCVNNTQYVVEINAGISQQLDLHEGDYITF